MKFYFIACLSALNKTIVSIYHLFFSGTSSNYNNSLTIVAAGIQSSLALFLVCATSCTSTLLVSHPSIAFANVEQHSLDFECLCANILWLE